MSEKMVLVMLHGWGSSALVWDKVRGKLSDQIDVFLPELPGHGASDLQPGNLNDVSQQVAMEINQFADSPVWILGWSLGAMVGMNITMNAFCNVAGLLLVGATPCFVQRSDWDCAMPKSVMTSFITDFKRQPEITLTRFCTLQAYRDEQGRHVIRQLRSAQMNTGKSIRWGLEVLENTDLREQIAAIQVPVYLLHGRYDAVVPAAAVGFFKEMTQFSCEIWDRVGHVPFASLPDRFAKWVNERIL